MIGTPVSLWPEDLFDFGFMPEPNERLLELSELVDVGEEVSVRVFEYQLPQFEITGSFQGQLFEASPPLALVIGEVRDPIQEPGLVLTHPVWVLLLQG